MQQDLSNLTYKHGGYDHFLVHDTKPRQIAVASVRDRVVHRLLYDYLVPIWDKAFIYDAWSCRPNKGLHRAIERAQSFMYKYPEAYVWRADIRKMFDSIDQGLMKQLLRRRIADPRALVLLDRVIDSYNCCLSKQASKQASKQGLPIGNLTSQIMANIYLNEFDRFMSHGLKPLAYLRYGDDWLCFVSDRSTAFQSRGKALQKLAGLSLDINPKVDHVAPTWKGIAYLGVDMWPNGRRLQLIVQERVNQRIDSHNVASYRALVATHQKPKRLKELNWRIVKDSS